MLRRTSGRAGGSVLEGTQQLMLDFAAGDTEALAGHTEAVDRNTQSIDRLNATLEGRNVPIEGTRHLLIEIIGGDSEGARELIRREVQREVLETIRSPVGQAEVRQAIDNR